MKMEHRPPYDEHVTRVQALAAELAVVTSAQHLERLRSRYLAVLKAHDQLYLPRSQGQIVFRAKSSVKCVVLRQAWRDAEHRVRRLAAAGSGSQ